MRTCIHVPWGPDCCVVNAWWFAAWEQASVGIGTRHAQLSVMCVLCVAEFERNVNSPAACTLHSLDSSVSKAPWFTLQNQTGLLSKCLFCWVIVNGRFCQNAFLFNDLNMHYDPRICRLQRVAVQSARWMVNRHCFLLSAAGSMCKD